MLTTLDNLKSRLAIADTDVTNDDLLTSAIEAVSARFENETNRTFARTENATFEFEADQCEISPPCYPIEFVSKFETKTSEAEGWVEQTGIDYLIRQSCLVSLTEPLNYELSTPRLRGSHIRPATSFPAPTPRPAKPRSQPTSSTPASNNAPPGSCTATKSVSKSTGPKAVYTSASFSCPCSRQSAPSSRNTSAGPFSTRGRFYGRTCCERRPLTLRLCPPLRIDPFMRQG